MTTSEHVPTLYRYATGVCRRCGVKIDCEGCITDGTDLYCTRECWDRVEAAKAKLATVLVCDDPQPDLSDVELKLLEDLDSKAAAAPWIAGKVTDVDSDSGPEDHDVTDGTIIALVRTGNAYEYFDQGDHDLVDVCSGFMPGRLEATPDQQLIIAMRNLLPRLLTEVRRRRGGG